MNGARDRRFGTTALAVTDRELRALLARSCMACGILDDVPLEHLMPLACLGAARSATSPRSAGHATVEV